MDVVDFKGYNKVADNTDPNLTAMLMGMTEEEHLKHPCGHQKKQKTAKYDDCPTIWKEFAARGYLTAYCEDAPGMGMFHFQKYGFVKEPMDYYNRPYFQALTKYKGNHHCVGHELSIKVIHDYALDFTREFVDVPYFGLFWTASLTHNDVKKASTADESSFRLLKTWNEDRLLNRTILLFLSDHGIRFGKIRDTYVGMLEERMPYVMMVFPKWFKYKHRQTWDILKVNSERLVNNFDIHLTLKDILNQGFHVSTNPRTKYNHGQSLFLEVPFNRTCEGADIPIHYCACKQTDSLSLQSPDTKKIVQYVISELNKGLKKIKQCAQLKLKEVR